MNIKTTLLSSGSTLVVLPLAISVAINWPEHSTWNPLLLETSTQTIAESLELDVVPKNPRHRYFGMRDDRPTTDIRDIHSLRVSYEGQPYRLSASTYGEHMEQLQACVDQANTEAERVGFGYIEKPAVISNNEIIANALDTAHANYLEAVNTLTETLNANNLPDSFVTSLSQTFTEIEDQHALSPTTIAAFYEAADMLGPEARNLVDGFNALHHDYAHDGTIRVKRFALRPRDENIKDHLSADDLRARNEASELAGERIQHALAPYASCDQNARDNIIASISTTIAHNNQGRMDHVNRDPLTRSFETIHIKAAERLADARRQASYIKVSPSTQKRKFPKTSGLTALLRAFKFN